MAGKINLGQVFPDILKCGFARVAALGSPRTFAAHLVLHLHATGNKQRAKPQHIRHMQGARAIFAALGALAQRANASEPRARELVLARHQPLYVHCDKGKHRTGCVIGCYRRMQVRAPSKRAAAERARAEHHGRRALRPAAAAAVGQRHRARRLSNVSNKLTNLFWREVESPLAINSRHRKTV